MQCFTTSWQLAWTMRSSGPNPIDPAEDGPVPIYNSRTKYSALILNLGSFARNRKRTAHSLYSDIIAYDDSGKVLAF